MLLLLLPPFDGKSRVLGNSGSIQGNFSHGKRTYIVCSTLYMYALMYYPPSKYYVRVALKCAQMMIASYVFYLPTCKESKQFYWEKSQKNKWYQRIPCKIAILQMLVQCAILKKIKLNEALCRYLHLFECQAKKKIQ